MRQPLPEHITRLNNRIVTTPSAVPAAPGEDPARAFVVYPSTPDMVRGSLLRTADQALSSAVMGMVNRAIPQQQSAAPVQRTEQPSQVPEGPVMLQPYGQRAAPVPPAPAMQADTPQAPPVDDAFVF